MYICIERERERESVIPVVSFDVPYIMNMMQKRTQCQFSCLSDLDGIKDDKNSNLLFVVEDHISAPATTRETTAITWKQ